MQETMWDTLQRSAEQSQKIARINYNGVRGKNHARINKDTYAEGTITRVAGWYISLSSSSS